MDKGGNDRINEEKRKKECGSKDKVDEDEIILKYIMKGLLCAIL